jgi:hypothetical protein
MLYKEFEDSKGAIKSVNRRTDNTIFCIYLAHIWRYNVHSTIYLVHYLKFKRDKSVNSCEFAIAHKSFLSVVANNDPLFKQEFTNLIILNILSWSQTCLQDKYKILYCLSFDLRILLPLCYLQTLYTTWLTFPIFTMSKTDRHDIT